MNKFLSIIFVILSISAYSQEYPQLILIENDSCIVFTLDQSKTMIEWDIRYDECKSNYEILTVETNIKDSIISNQLYQILEYQKIDSLCQQINIENKGLISLYEDETKVLKKQLTRQKRKTWLYSSLGLVATTVLTTLYIIK
jgi:hypothetical protein